MKPEDYLEAILYLITTPDAFSGEDADKLIEDATICLRKVFGKGARSMKLMYAVSNYQDYQDQRREELEQIKALQGQTREEKR